VINLEIARHAVDIAAIDPELSVDQLAPAIQVRANVNNSAGRSLPGSFVLGTSCISAAVGSTPLP